MELKFYTMKFNLIKLVILLLALEPCVAQSEKHPDSSEKNMIGFSSQSVVDKSRPSIDGGNMGRTLQINMWYPARAKKKAPKMAFTDYIRVKQAEPIGDKPKPNYGSVLESYFKWPLSQGANKSLLDSIALNDIEMKAVKNIEAAGTKGPLVLLMHGSAVDFAFLAESLAQEGYTVINVPHKGYLKQDLDVNGIGMETEIRDYEFALSFLADHKNIQWTDITAIGFSFGGQSALGLACRNPNIKTVISYDGGIGSKFGARLISESAFCGIENVSVSILHVYDASYPQNYLDKIRSFVHSDRTLLGINQIAHWHFTSFGYLHAQVPHLFGESKYSEKGYETILGITKEYLHSKSKNENRLGLLSKDKVDLIHGVEHQDRIQIQ